MGWCMSATKIDGVYALNAATGAKLWSLHHRRLRVVVARGGQWGGLFWLRRLQCLCAERRDRRYAVELHTGNYVDSSPAVANGVVYVGSDDRNVYALNASTGAKLWSYTTGDIVYSSPAVANGVVYVGSYDDNVYALNALTGAKLWSFTTGDDVVFLARSGQWGGLCRLR